eukprot:6954329-Pyramimonas_sp.AAC.1
MGDSLPANPTGVWERRAGADGCAGTGDPSHGESTARAMSTRVRLLSSPGNTCACRRAKMGAVWDVNVGGRAVSA